MKTLFLLLLTRVLGSWFLVAGAAGAAEEAPDFWRITNTATGEILAQQTKPWAVDEDGVGIVPPSLVDGQTVWRVFVGGQPEFDVRSQELEARETVEAGVIRVELVAVRLPNATLKANVADEHASRITAAIGDYGDQLRQLMIAVMTLADMASGDEIDYHRGGKNRTAAQRKAQAVPILAAQMEGPEAIFLIDAWRDTQFARIDAGLMPEW